MKPLRKDWAEEAFLTALKIRCARVNLFPEEFRFVSMKLDLLTDRKIVANDGYFHFGAPKSSQSAGLFGKSHKKRRKKVAPKQFQQLCS